MNRTIDYMVTGSTAADISGLYAMSGRQEGSMIQGNQD